MSTVDRVVVLALDGMRVDLLGPTTTPVLWALRERAHLFSRARSVFPSYTRVCTASVMAGALPERHGIVGNAFHHPAAGHGGALHLDRTEDVHRLLQADGAGIVGPTLDRALASAGRRMGLVNGNSAGTAMLMLPNPAADGHWAFNPLAARHARCLRPGTKSSPGMGHLRLQPCPWLRGPSGSPVSSLTTCSSGSTPRRFPLASRARYLAALPRHRACRHGNRTEGGRRGSGGSPACDRSRWADGGHGGARLQRPRADQLPQSAVDEGGLGRPRHRRRAWPRYRGGRRSWPVWRHHPAIGW